LPLPVNQKSGRQAIANCSNVRTTFLKQNLMVSARCESTSASCASAIYMRDAHFPAVGILTQQQNRTR
jgi:hypothetical protein